VDNPTAVQKKSVRTGSMSNILFYTMGDFRFQIRPNAITGDHMPTGKYNQMIYDSEILLEKEGLSIRVADS
jgi:hypothetical protein